MKKKLLFLGADSSTTDAVRYARSKDIHTIVTDNRPPEAVEAKQLSDEYWMISVAEMDELEKKCREESVSGVYAGNQEFCLDCCKELCRRLGLPFYASEEGWRVSRDKLLYKKLSRECGLKTPEQFELDDSFNRKDLDLIRYPVIVKPADSSAQQGLSLVRNEEELLKAYYFAMSFSPSKRIVVEEWIEGYEVFLFCFIHKGIVRLLGVSEDLPASDINGRSNFGFGIHKTRYSEQIEKELMPSFQKMAEKLRCREGTCVFQGIFRDNEYYSLELGYRLDGIRSWRHFSKVCGVNQLALMVDLALGILPDDQIFTEMIPEEERPLSIGYVIWGRPGKVEKVIGQGELHERDDIIILLENYSTGSEILANDNMRSIVYDMTIFGDSYEELSCKVKEINGLLHLYDPQGRDLLIYQELPVQSWRGNDR